MLLALLEKIRSKLMARFNQLMVNNPKLMNKYFNNLNQLSKRQFPSQIEKLTIRKIFLANQVS